jgi:SAM-dependent methyltransferase
VARTEDRIRIEPGSFRDPDSRVYVTSEGVYRVLSDEGLTDWRALADSGQAERLAERGMLIPTEELTDAASLAADLPQIGGALVKGTAAVLRHERIPFVSYPYEWPFGMLKDAALLQLDLMLALIDEGMTLKDASPYNVQWRGARPVFVDVGSIERLREGEPWAGYRQFCMLYLYPLLLQAHKGIAFHALLRGAIDGIPPSDAARLFSRRDRLRRGVLRDVWLHSRLERRFEASEGRELKRELRAARFSTELIKANLRRLRKIVAKLDWSPPGTAWTGYRETSTYTDEDERRKRDFVSGTASAASFELAWDLGCNDGAYSRLVAGPGRYVVAVDADHETVEGVYRALRDEGNESILPLVGNLADPSPGLGWRGLERRPLADRGRPDLVLALALVHHLAITANLPVREIVDWLKGLGATVVVEFPTREDPMVRRLLSGKRDDANPDYELSHFERCLEDAFRIERSEPLPSGTRVLYHVTPLA